VEELMLNPTELVKDEGTMLEGEEAVKEGLIDEVGGIKEALQKLHELIVNFSKNGDDTSFQ
jgi:ATP-dependent protease ClpP protease subunit